MALSHALAIHLAQSIFADWLLVHNAYLICTKGPRLILVSDESVIAAVPCRQKLAAGPNCVSPGLDSPIMSSTSASRVLLLAPRPAIWWRSANITACSTLIQLSRRSFTSVSPRPKTTHKNENPGHENMKTLLRSPNPLLMLTLRVSFERTELGN